jgi:hypothetical protein
MTAWWIWYGPAVTKQEVRRELTEMHQAGLGGVTIYPCYPMQTDDPARGIRNLRFLSNEYLGVYRYAIQVATSLGMTVDVIGGSGWPYGGPSVSIDDSSHALRSEKHKLERLSPTEVANLKPDERLVAVFASSAEDPTFHDVTASATADGRLSLPGETGGEALSIIATPVGLHVKRPAWGGEGYVLDHLSAQAFNRYAQSILEKLVADVPRGHLRAIFADSLEAYGSDWTAGFPAAFEQRRGYDLRHFYPVLFDSADTRAADVRFDYWETVADLFVDGFARPLHEWAKSHELKSEIQAYGVPAVPQRSYAEVDFPGGEQYDWKNFTEGRWASSAAHFYGKNRVLAEYATWAGIPNRFTDTLDDLKLIADLQFLTGMTELHAATLPYSPPGAGVPGWQDYAGAAFGIYQSWWPFFPNLTTYVSRASYLLEQGRPVSTVLVYLPVEDVEANAPLGSLHTVFRVRDHLAQTQEEIPEFGLKNALNYQTPLLSTILGHGYTFDGISGDILEARGVVRDARLEVGEGSYNVVVLPRLTGMRIAALERIAELVRSGGTAIAVGRLPERCYGGTQPDKNSERLRDVITQMFGASSQAYADHPYGSGRAIFVNGEADLPRALEAAGRPDMQLESPDPDIGFVHRRVSTSSTDNADYYFVVNTGEAQKRIGSWFDVSHRKPQIWDLEHGTSFDPASYRFEKDRTEIELSLGPRRSVVVYFGASGDPSPISATNLAEPTLMGGTVEGTVAEPGDYYVETASGRLKEAIATLPDPLTLTGPWDLRFDSSPVISEKLPVLRSWTEDSKTQHFSGSCTYSTEVNVPRSYLGNRRLLWLDLGDVRYAARVWVNGHLVGDAWQPPFKLEVGYWLQPGRNWLKIQVANLLINSLLGHKPPDYSKLISVYGDRFPYPEDWKINPKPWPAGLMGPVRLVPGVRLRFRLHSQPACTSHTSS